MGTVERFEDLDWWKEARRLVGTIYSLARAEPFSKDWGFRDQIQRASISTMSNIAEGFEAQTNKEFIVYLFYAKKSSGEVRSQLYAARDIGYINESQLRGANEQAVRVSRMLSGFISYLKLKRV